MPTPTSARARDEPHDVGLRADAAAGRDRHHHAGQHAHLLVLVDRGPRRRHGSCALHRDSSSHGGAAAPMTVPARGAAQTPGRRGPTTFTAASAPGHLAATSRSGAPAYRAAHGPGDRGARVSGEASHQGRGARRLMAGAAGTAAVATGRRPAGGLARAGGGRRRARGPTQRAGRAGRRHGLGRLTGPQPGVPDPDAQRRAAGGVGDDLHAGLRHTQVRAHPLQPAHRQRTWPGAAGPRAPGTTAAGAGRRSCPASRRWRTSSTATATTAPPSASSTWAGTSSCGALTSSPGLQPRGSISTSSGACPRALLSQGFTTLFLLLRGNPGVALRLLRERQAGRRAGHDGAAAGRPRGRLLHPHPRHWHAGLGQHPGRPAPDAGRLEFVDCYDDCNVARGHRRPSSWALRAASPHDPVTPPASTLGVPIRGASSLGPWADMAHQNARVAGSSSTPWTSGA